MLPEAISRDQSPNIACSSGDVHEPDRAVTVPLQSDPGEIPVAAHTLPSPNTSSRLSLRGVTASSWTSQPTEDMLPSTTRSNPKKKLNRSVGGAVQGSAKVATSHSSPLANTTGSMVSIAARGSWQTSAPQSNTGVVVGVVVAPHGLSEHSSTVESVVGALAAVVGAPVVGAAMEVSSKRPPNVRANPMRPTAIKPRATLPNVPKVEKNPTLGGGKSRFPRRTELDGAFPTPYRSTGSRAGLFWIDAKIPTSRVWLATLNRGRSSWSANASSKT